MTRNDQSIRNESWASVVEARLKHLRFGVVQITVHDGRVVQIDTTERTRLNGGNGHGQSQGRESLGFDGTDGSPPPTGTTGGPTPHIHAGATEQSEFPPRRHGRRRNSLCDRIDGSEQP